MSLVVWSYATLGMEDMILFGRVAELATPRLMEFKPVELTNAMWALAKGKTDSPIFFEAAALVVATRASELSASCACLLCWSLATALPHLEVARNSSHRHVQPRHGLDRPNFGGVVLGCIEAKFRK